MGDLVRIVNVFLVYIVIAGWILAPAAAGVWVWRCSRSWLRVLGGVGLLVPAASFVLGGGILATWTAFRIYALNVGPTGPDLRMPNWFYIGHTFLTCGVYGVGFNGLGLMLSVPLLGLWFFFHRASFRRITSRSGGPVPPSAPGAQ